MNINTQIEALLFWKAEPMTVWEIAKILKVPPEKIEEALIELETKLVGRGVQLLRANDNVELRTHSDASTLIKNLRREELSRDLGKSGLETLAIIAYKGPLSRRDIEYIRGVNSTFILRNLLIRGLIERISSEKDQRSFLYRPTLDLLSHIGITKIEDLPEFAAVQREIDVFEKNIETSENESRPSEFPLEEKQTESQTKEKTNHEN